MKPLVIFGAGGLARLALFYFTNDTPYEVAAFTVHQDYLKEKSLLGLEVVPFESIETLYPPEHYAVFVAIGFWGVNGARAEIYESCKSKGYEMATYISSQTHQWGEFEVGDNCMILEGAIINPYVKIGNDVIINPGTLVSHDSIIGHHCFLGANAVINGSTKIGDYSLIGANATLVERLTIGSKCVIGAGVTITKDMQSGAVYLPNDAQLLPMESDELARYQYADLARTFHREDSVKPDAETPAAAGMHEPFPLTPIQQAYWVGRRDGMPLGGVSTHFYFEVEANGLDLSRLTWAWRRLIDRHPMLRAVIAFSGKQHILEDVPAYAIRAIEMADVEKPLQKERIRTLRAEMSHQVLPSDQWPLFDIRALLLDKNRMLLLMSFDSLIMDERSRNLLFTEWEQLYRNPETNLPEPRSSFYRYILQLEAFRQSGAYQEDTAYWNRCLPLLPPSPELPLERKPSEIVRSRFSRFEERLDPSVWGAFKEQAKRRGLRPTAAVLAAFAETLRLWSSTPQMTLNLTITDQTARNPEFENVVGEFTSSLLLAVSHDTALSFEAQVLRLQKQLETDLRHSGISGVEVVRERIKQRGNDLGSLMPVVFTSHLSADNRRGGGNPMAWLGETKYAITQTPQACLDYQTHEWEGTFIGVWDVVEELFPDQMLKEMAASHFRLLRRLAADPDIWMQNAAKRAPEQLPSSHRRLYESMNETHKPGTTKLLHEAILDQMRRRPDQPAVISEERTLTYAQLAQESADVAHWLQRNGAAPDQLVAVVMGKGWENIVAILGILRSGAAYLPLDPTLPRQRLDHLLKHGRVELILSQPCWDQTLKWPENTKCLTLGGQSCGAADALESAGEGPFCSAQHDDLAYVIYTSGSTGLPKGVMISHRSAVNTLEDINERFGIGPGDRVFAVSPLSFDLSVFDIFGPLSAGGTVVFPAVEDAKDPSRWLHLIKEHKITIWNSAPALMQLLSEYCAQHGSTLGDALRLVLLSGDWLSLELPDQIRKLAPSSLIVSLGGATEASIWSILYPIGTIDPSWNSIPYGAPMQNQRFYVFDDALQLRPLWVPGELYIGGEGLAMGYWRDPERTKQSFVIHPDTGERLYRTGDIGRLLDNGLIEFLGRIDDQVKIRGFRVEPKEIEIVLKRHAKIRKSAVIAQGSEKRKNRLVAYVLPSEGEELTEDELRTFVRERLPDYMQPSMFVRVEQFPLSANGKIDRKALGEMAEAKAYESDVNPEHSEGPLSTLMQIASEVLRIDNIDPAEQLLSLGATSVDVIRVINRLEQALGIRPTVDEVYRAENFYRLAEAVEERLRRSSALPSEPGRGCDSTPAVCPSSNKLLLDPAEREDFRASLPALRRDLSGRPAAALPPVEPDSGEMHRWSARRSYRHFTQESLRLESIGKLLGCLHGKEAGGIYRYNYGSAGRLYPVQTYLYIKPGRVKELEAGVYYYHPLEHRLIRLSMPSKLPGEIYDPLINRPIFGEAAFGLFLIADLSAIMPMYGERSRHYATIEAGLMTQLLEEAAPMCGLGLCQIGELDFSRIRPFFELNDEQLLVHSLLGGGR